MDEPGASNTGASISTTSTSQIDRGIGRFTNLRRSPRFLNKDRTHEPGASIIGTSLEKHRNQHSIPSSQNRREIKVGKDVETCCGIGAGSEKNKKRLLEMDPILELHATDREKRVRTGSKNDQETRTSSGKLKSIDLCYSDIETNKTRCYEVDLQQRSLQLQMRRAADRARRSSDVNQETGPAGASISTSQTEKAMAGTHAGDLNLHRSPQLTQHFNLKCGSGLSPCTVFFNTTILLCKWKMY